jgi:hypothetical protein
MDALWVYQKQPTNLQNRKQIEDRNNTTKKNTIIDSNSHNKLIRQWRDASLNSMRYNTITQPVPLMVPSICRNPHKDTIEARNFLPVQLQSLCKKVRAV